MDAREVSAQDIELEYVSSPASPIASGSAAPSTARHDNTTWPTCPKSSRLSGGTTGCYAATAQQ
ncbi:hypothetical protein [Streptomyces sp. NPDC050535]|uniref:hypothetical protein n=1 Tax=Streptomyces sp. NPDC050535 TaxID=3365626 RepID=UPI0037BA72EC